MISLLIPTRNRPDNIDRVYGSAMDMASNPNDLEFVFYIDQDDELSHTATAISGELPNVKVIKGERIVLSQMWNICYEQAAGPYYFHMGDDIVFRTPNWDAHFVRAFERYPDRIAFVYGNDGGPRGPIFGTHGMLHENWVKTVGYFVPPYFSSDFNDTWWNDVSERIGRKVFVPEVYTEHMHWTLDKAEVDSTTSERLDRHTADNPEAIYNAKGNEREQDAEKLLTFIKEFKA